MAAAATRQLEALICRGVNFRNIQRESLILMSSDELFLGNIVVAVAEGDVRLSADKSAAVVGVGEERWAERDALA